jgi:hypothetical protein
MMINLRAAKKVHRVLWACQVSLSMQLIQILTTTSHNYHSKWFYHKAPFQKNEFKGLATKRLESTCNLTRIQLRSWYPLPKTRWDRKTNLIWFQSLIAKGRLRGVVGTSKSGSALLLAEKSRKAKRHPLATIRGSSKTGEIPLSQWFNYTPSTIITTLTTLRYTWLRPQMESARSPKRESLSETKTWWRTS